MRELLAQGTFYFIIRLTVCVSVTVLFMAVFMDFAVHSRKTGVQKEKKSIVDTATMTLFFIVVYLIVQSGTGRITGASGLNELLMAAGTIMIVFGCTANIWGRFNLGRNWANQVKIYREQTLVRNGMYKYVRHPLYASIILMFYGAGLVYRNIVTVIIVTVVFVPFMYYRAWQEERLLLERFPQYEEYRNTVGMFFPKILKRKEHI